VASQPLK